MKKEMIIVRLGMLYINVMLNRFDYIRFIHSNLDEIIRFIHDKKNYHHICIHDFYCFIKLGIDLTNNQ